MTDQLTVSLDDLKRAIDAVPEFPKVDLPVSYLQLQALAGEYHAKRADAWRTAFEWREGLDDRVVALMADGWKVDEAHSIERREGLRLIREKLR